MRRFWLWDGMNPLWCSSSRYLAGGFLVSVVLQHGISHRRSEFRHGLRRYNLGQAIDKRSINEVSELYKLIEIQLDGNIYWHILSVTKIMLGMKLQLEEQHNVSSNCMSSRQASFLSIR